MYWHESRGDAMNSPERWSDRLFSVAVTLLVAAVALYIAAKLIIAVLPVLIGAGIVGAIGWAVWSLHRFRQSRW
jgi:NhaP-type Na+/H+ or K+/H+ antiporter